MPGAPRSDISCPGAWRPGLAGARALGMPRALILLQGRIHRGQGSGEGAEQPSSRLDPARLTLGSRAVHWQGKEQPSAEDLRTLKQDPASLAQPLYCGCHQQLLGDEADSAGHGSRGSPGRWAGPRAPGSCLGLCPHPRPSTGARGLCQQLVASPRNHLLGVCRLPAACHSQRRRGQEGTAQGPAGKVT